MNKLFIIFLLSFFFLGCATISPSPNKKSDRIVNQHLKGVTVTATGLIAINKMDFFPSSFMIQFDNTTLFIDPILVDLTNKADYILITHEHLDHFSPTDISNLMKENTTILCPKKVYAAWGAFQSKLVRPDERIRFENFSVETITSYNQKPIFLWLNAHSKEDDNVGYVIEANGARLFFAGDSDFVPEMTGLSNIDIAFLPVGGDGLTMDITNAAEFAKVVQPKTIVPTHYVVDTNKIAESLKALLPQGVGFMTME